MLCDFLRVPIILGRAQRCHAAELWDLGLASLVCTGCLFIQVQDLCETVVGNALVQRLVPGGSDPPLLAELSDVPEDPLLYLIRDRWFGSGMGGQACCTIPLPIESRPDHPQC